ncbi:hypothetical protein D3C71_1819360 [compost metagenome]
MNGMSSRCLPVHIQHLSFSVDADQRLRIRSRPDLESGRCSGGDLRLDFEAFQPKAVKQLAKLAE